MDLARRSAGFVVTLALIGYGYWVYTHPMPTPCPECQPSRDFAPNLRAAILAHPDHCKDAGPILKFLDEPDSPAHRRKLWRMERHVEAHLELPAHGDVDWSAINWALVIGAVIKLLILLLPLM